MTAIAEYFWRLIPANPILLRVVQMNGKRPRDLFIRCAYLGLLIGVVIISIWGHNSGNLSELAKTSANLFQILSYCQLALVALLAPIFTAGAITQEKDSQTYDILLATPLSNGQILLGSLLSRVFFVIALLISGIPIFSITQIFGGVAISAIVTSFFIAASTALVTGAIAMAIAVLKVGTRRTIFSFYLFIVVYLVGTFMLDRFEYFKVGVLNPATNSIELSRTSWLTGINPFLALRTIFHDAAYTPPAVGDLAKEYQRWPLGWYLCNPANFYVTFMFFISFVLISPSILLLRRLAQSTTSLRTVILQKLKIKAGDRTRKPRNVWSNPIAWREARTKASAARATFMRYLFILLGLGGAVVMLSLFATSGTPQYPAVLEPNAYDPQTRLLRVNYPDGNPLTLPIDPAATFSYTDEQTRQATIANNGQTPAPPASIESLLSQTGNQRVSVNAKPRINENGVQVAWISIDAVEIPRRLSAADTRRGLLAATIVEFAVILLIVTNAAASTVTREKEDGTLDLLLSTPITSRYYIWGKLRGLVSFVIPLVAVPVGGVAIFVVYDFVRLSLNLNDSSFRWTVFPESLLLLPGMLIIIVAFASIVGMQMSLRLRKTVVAVMSSIGIVVGLCALMGWCGYSLMNSRNAENVGLAASAFSPFTLMTVLINPYAFEGDMFEVANAAGSRMTVFICTWIAVAAYAGAVWGMYKSMVKNFDMTIRKQSR